MVESDGRNPGTGIFSRKHTRRSGMNRRTCITGIGALVVVSLGGSAWADRTPMRRTSGQREHGTRPDISVPYTTNGRTSFGVWQGVNPRVVVTPNVDDPKNP